MLDIRTALVLSLAHVTKETADILNNTPHADWPVCGGPYAYFGWFVYAHDEDSEGNIPPEIFAACEYARRHGCNWIVYDEAGEVNPDLPTFKWPEPGAEAATAPGGPETPDAPTPTQDCETCQGNGEVVTDWDRYLKPHPGDKGDEAVAPCEDCAGTGTVDADPEPAPAPLNTYSVLLAWGQSDEGEYGTCVQAPDHDEATRLARLEMWITEHGDDYAEDEEIPAEDVPEYDVLEIVEGSNIWSAGELLEALKLARPLIAYMAIADSAPAREEATVAKAASTLAQLDKAMARGEGRAA